MRPSLGNRSDSKLKMRAAVACSQEEKDWWHRRLQQIVTWVQKTIGKTKMMTNYNSLIPVTKRLMSMKEPKIAKWFHPVINLKERRKHPQRSRISIQMAKKVKVLCQMKMNSNLQILRHPLETNTYRRQKPQKMSKSVKTRVILWQSIVAMTNNL